MACDQVQLSEPAAEITVQDFEALGPQEALSNPLGFNTQLSCPASPKGAPTVHLRLFSSGHP